MAYGSLWPTVHYGLRAVFERGSGIGYGLARDFSRGASVPSGYRWRMAGITFVGYVMVLAGYCWAWAIPAEPKGLMLAFAALFVVYAIVSQLPRARVQA
jgi:hypothetical protein